jgi:ABC-2 type transport system permease protein
MRAGLEPAGHWAKEKQIMQKLFRDTWLIFVRSLMLTLRNPVWVFIGLLQPVLYLALYAPLLKPLSSGPGFPTGGAFNVFVPGLLVQLAMFSTFSGFGLIAELRAGVVERMRVTPISRVSMLLGRALRDVAILLVQSALIIICALPFGLTIAPVGIVVSLVLVALLGLIMTTFSYTVALAVRSEDVLAPTINAVFLPVLLLSGILLPMTLAPTWLQWVAAFNPFSHAVNAMRALFAGDVINGTVAFGVGLMVVLCAISLFFAGRAFAKSQA